MARFIHTADWQIGKPYLQIKDEEKRFKLKRERIDVIKRIRNAAKEEEAQFILIAGDLFDSPTPSISAITEILKAIGEIDISFTNASLFMVVSSLAILVLFSLGT